MIYIHHPRSDLTKEIDAMLDIAEEEVSNVVPMDGRKERRARTREELLRTGLDLFLRDAARPSDMEIVKKANRSVRSFYQIFGTTEGYWMEVFTTYEQSIKAKIAQTLEQGDGFTLLRLIFLGKK